VVGRRKAGSRWASLFGGVFTERKPLRAKMVGVENEVLGSDDVLGEWHRGGPSGWGTYLNK